MEITVAPDLFFFEMFDSNPTMILNSIFWGNNEYLQQIIASFYNLSYYIQEIVICWDPPQYGYKDFLADLN